MNWLCRKMCGSFRDICPFEVVLVHEHEHDHAWSPARTVPKRQTNHSPIPPLVLSHMRCLAGHRGRRRSFAGKTLGSVSSERFCGPAAQAHADLFVFVDRKHAELVEWIIQPIRSKPPPLGHLVLAARYRVLSLAQIDNTLAPIRLLFGIAHFLGPWSLAALPARCAAEGSFGSWTFFFLVFSVFFLVKIS